eukprot:jgi/Mesvir1/15771/Mv03340-RA.1
MGFAAASIVRKAALCSAVRSNGSVRIREPRQPFPISARCKLAVELGGTGNSNLRHRSGGLTLLATRNASCLQWSARGNRKSTPTLCKSSNGSTGAAGSEPSAASSTTSVSAAVSSAPPVVPLTALMLLLCNMDRICMSVAILPMAAEFGWGEAAQGVIQSAFLWGYTATQFVGGSMADKFGGEKVLFWGLLWWSLATVIMPMALKAPLELVFPAVVFARVVVGLGEGVAMPSANNLIASWMPPRLRSQALGAIMAGFHGGTMAGLLLAPPIMTRFGWRSLFVVFGVLGLPLLVAWKLFIPPRQAPAPTSASSLPSSDHKAAAAASQAEQRDSNSGSSGALQVSDAKAPKEAAVSTAAARDVSLGELLSKPPVWAIIIANFVNHWGYFIFLSWMPSYLFKVLGFNVRRSALFSVLPWTAMALVGYAVGWLADKAIASGVPIGTVRKTTQSISFLGPAASLLLLSGTKDPGWAVGYLCLALGLSAFNNAGFLANIHDIAPRHAGRIFGFSNTGGSISGIIGTACTGAILELTGSWKPIFYVTIAFYLLGTAAWLSLCSGERLFDTS